MPKNAFPFWAYQGIWQPWILLSPAHSGLSPAFDVVPAAAVFPHLDARLAAAAIVRLVSKWQINNFTAQYQKSKCYPKAS